MTTLHFLDPQTGLLDRLADLMIRRRVCVTRGDIELANGAAALIGLVTAESDVRSLVQAARAAKMRNLVAISLGAESLRVETEHGGSLLRLHLPASEQDIAARHAEPLLTYVAEMIAHPIRPMVACDPATGGLIDLASRVAQTDVTVLINGPTGSGKEVLARAIHDASPRAGKPFVALNCAAIPDNMLEAMLFGHVKGSFTGAVAAGQGLIRAADGGTLLLDEITEMPLALQAKLLRVLQERKVTPLGSSGEIAVDLRILSTTNRGMRTEVAAGRFREDLYYRLNVFPLQTLALQDRPEDIAPLAIAFLRRHWQLGAVPLPTPTAMDMLRFHTWPGNVRELENVMQRALVLCDGRRITTDDIMLDSAEMPAPKADPAPTRLARRLAAAV